MRAILIDPTTKSVDEVDYDGDFQSIARMIGCDFFKSALLIETGDDTDPDIVYVDDNGLLTNPNPRGYFRLPGLSYPGTLAGKGLILGCDDEGADAPALTRIDNIRRAVEFVDTPDPADIEPKISIYPLDLSDHPFLRGIL